MQKTTHWNTDPVYLTYTPFQFITTPTVNETLRCWNYQRKIVVVQNAPAAVSSDLCSQFNFQHRLHQALRKILVIVFQYLTVARMLKEIPIRELLEAVGPENFLLTLLMVDKSKVIRVMWLITGLSTVPLLKRLLLNVRILWMLQMQKPLKRPKFRCVRYFGLCLYAS